MYITCKKSPANLKLMDNLIASPDTSTVPMASCADRLDYGQEVCGGGKLRLIACCQ